MHPRFLNHDHSILAFNERVLDWAQRDDVPLLREAVRRGKEVCAAVKLKTRFDKEANFDGAECLESIGAQVVYGVVELKTHCKMLRSRGVRASS